MVVALLALFVALDGPATAARLIDGRSIRSNSITTRQIRNHTIRSQDLSPTLTRTIHRPPKDSITAAQIKPKSIDASRLADGLLGAPGLAPKSVDAGKLVDGSIGTGQLATAAVTPSKIADGSVGSAAIADGGLQAQDVGDFFGSVIVDFPAMKVNDCQTAPVTPTPTGNADAQIADDVIVVTPAAGFSDLITVTGNPGVGNILRLIACRVGADHNDPSPDNTVDPPPTRFYYLGVDAP